MSKIINKEISPRRGMKAASSAAGLCAGGLLQLPAGCLAVLVSEARCSLHIKAAPLLEGNPAGQPQRRTTEHRSFLGFSM